MNRSVSRASNVSRGADSHAGARSERASNRDRTTASTAARSLEQSQLRERALGLLIDLTKSAEPQVKANAIESLQHAPGRLALIAPELLNDPSPGVRGVAALAVAKSRICGCEKDVRPLLHDPSELVRASAILSLWKCNKQVDPTPLAAMLNSDRANVRAHAAWVLGEMKEPSALDMLAEAARDTIPRASPGAMRLVDLQIAEARVKLGDDSALSEIRTALYPARNEDLEAAALAAQIIGDLRDEAFANGLMALAAEKDQNGQPMPAEIRLAAAGSLAKLGMKQGDEIAIAYSENQNATIRAQAALVLGNLQKAEHLPVLENLLDDPSGQVQAAAAGAIVQILDSETMHQPSR